MNKDYGKKPTENWSIETFWSDEEKESLSLSNTYKLVPLTSFRTEKNYAGLLRSHLLWQPTPWH